MTIDNLKIKMDDKYFVFLGKIFLSLLISLWIFGLAYAILPGIIPIFMIFSIYVNRKRFKFLKKYKRYVKALFVAYIIYVLSKFFGLGFGYIGITFLEIFLPDFILISIIYFIYALIYAVPIYYLYRFFKREKENNGIPYPVSTKICTITFLSIVFLLFGILSGLSHHLFNGDAIFHDFSALDNIGEAHSIDMNNIETAFSSDGTMDVNIPKSTSINTTLENMPSLHEVQPNESVLSNQDFSTHVTLNTELNKIPDKIILQDNMGMTEGKIVQTSAQDFVLQDSAGQTEITAHADYLDNIDLQNQMGQHVGTITNDGTIKGADGLTDGNVTTLENGDQIVKDTQGLTVAKIKADGTVLDSQNMSLGAIKK